MHPQIFSTSVTGKAVDQGRLAGWHRLITVAAAAVLNSCALCAIGCAPQLQTQIIGRTTAIAGPPVAAAPVVAAEIPVPESHSAQVLRYVVTVPHAVQLHYQVTCPSAQREGTMGETFESYRTRRLAELERERQQQANLIGAVVGAVAPPVRAGAGVAGPGGSATVTGEVDPGAVAAQAARESLPAPTLPPAILAPPSCAAPWSWARRRPDAAR